MFMQLRTPDNIYCIRRTLCSELIGCGVREQLTPTDSRESCHFDHCPFGLSLRAPCSHHETSNQIRPDSRDKCGRSFDIDHR